MTAPRRRTRARSASMARHPSGLAAVYPLFPQTGGVGTLVPVRSRLVAVQHIARPHRMTLPAWAATVALGVAAVGTMSLSVPLSELQPTGPPRVWDCSTSQPRGTVGDVVVVSTAKGCERL